MKTSKKILSVILAVVMVITTCSVGFIAFAKDNNSNAYWTDKNNTDADTAFKSLNNLVDYFVPSLLKIEISEGQTIADLVGIKDPDSATLSDVVEGASPLLMNVLGVAKADDKQRQAIIMKHLGQDPEKDTYYRMYDNYFSYLDSDSKISFFDLYQFCNEVLDPVPVVQADGSTKYEKSTLGKNDDLYNWCQSTRTILDTYLDLYDVANANFANAEKAYDALKADKTIEATSEKKLNGVAYKDLANKTANPDSYNDYAYGVEIAQSFYDKLGVDLTIANPADALYYYFSDYGVAFAQGLIAIYLSDGQISTSKIVADKPNFTTSNVMEILTANVDQYAEDHDGKQIDTSYLVTDFINDHTDIITTTGIGDLAPVKDMTAAEAQAAGYLYSGTAYDITGWPVHDPSAPSSGSGTTRYYFYINPSTNKVARAPKNNATGVANAQKAIATPYYNAYQQANAEVNIVQMYGDMIKACYQDINQGSTNLGVYRSSAYTTMVENALKETGRYENVADAINAAKISDGQITTASEYFKSNSLSTDTDFKNYLNSGSNVFSGEVSAYLAKLDSTTIQALTNALTSASPVSEFKAVTVSGSNAPYEIRGLSKPYDIANFSVSSKMLYDFIGSDKIGSYSTACSAGSITANVPVIYQEIFKYSIIAPQLNNEDNKFEYTGALVIPDEFAVFVVNETINGYINEFLDPNSSVGSIIDGAVSGLLDSNVNLQAILNDIWKNLAEKPIETVFNLLPTVVVLLDEVLVPILFNQDGDAYNGMLYSLLATDEGILAPYTLAAGNTAIGITALSFDLNKLLPGLLEWFKYNDGSDAKKATAIKAAKKFVNTYAQNGYDVIVETDDNGNETIVDGNDVLAFTGIYVADKALMGANLGTSFIRVLTNAGLSEDLATGINEVVEKVVDIADEVVLDYVEKQATNPDIKYTTSDVQSTEGLNDIFVALPQIIDGIGKKLVKDLKIKKAEDSSKASDWAYCYSGKLVKEEDKNGHIVLRNKDLQDFKKAGEANNGAVVLETFVNIFIGHQLNAFIDLFNDIFADDTNEITKNIPLVQGLLKALGGLGEKSIITDVLDGFFQLKRSDDVSFEIKKRSETKFVGFSTESGLYLIANLFSKLDKENPDNNKGLVPFIMNLVADSGSNSASAAPASEDSYGIATAAAGPVAAYVTLSSKNVDYKSALTKSNIKAADKLIGKVDTLLASLLKNTTINGFDLTATDSILSGVISTVSNYIGENNTNDVINLLDKYLEAIVGTNGTSKNGKVNANEVYTSKKLTVLVTETYALLENIIDYLLRGALGTKDKNGIIAGAISGVISPDAVGVRMGSKYSNTADILLNSKNLTWSNVKANCKDLKFGFSNGDKAGFYDALGESLSGIAAILGVALTASYTSTAKTDNYYSALVYPVLSKIAKATGAKGVMTPADFNKASDSQKLIKGIVTPLASILDQFYKAPASFLINTIKGLAAIADDDSIKSLVKNAIAPINTFFTGVENLVAVVSPTLSKVVKNLIDENINIDIKLPKKNVLASLITGISIGDATIGDYVAVDSLDFKKVANAKSPAEVLLIIYAYVVDNVLNSDLLTGLVDSLAPDVSKIIKNLSAGGVLKLLNEILGSFQSPTEAYWSFSEYYGTISKDFKYPNTITSAEANAAITKLDGSVDAVFSLLNDLNVTNVNGLAGLVNDNLYTNEILTKIAVAVYGALEKNDTVGTVLGVLGLDLSPAGFASYLMDKSYGNTYSSAAATLKKAKSWSSVKSLNWGFKDGSSMARTGFVNGIAALVRPVNSILAILLAEDGQIKITKADVNQVVELIKTLELDKTEIPVAADSEAGALLKLSIKSGVLNLVIDSNNSKDNSIVKADLAKIAKDFLNTFTDINANFGTNGYESAIIPILEAFMCKDVKTYKQYLADYSKAKDTLITNILNPITLLVDDVTNAPFDTLTKILPNVAYFIDNNGVTQAIGNLLAPITAKDGLLGVLAKNGIDVDKLIKAIAGKSLGDIVTDLLDVDVKLTLDLGNLKTSNIQDIVFPLVKNLLKDKLGLTLPTFSFEKIASHGTIVTVNSAAKNSDGAFKTRQVVANQGEVLIAVLRYVLDTAITNIDPIEKLVNGIDAISKNKQLQNIIGSIFNQLKIATPDDIIIALFNFLTDEPTDRFFDYSNFEYKSGYKFSFGDMDEDFCRKLAPMLDGLIGGVLPGGLNALVGDALYKDELVSKLATGLYGAIEGVELGKAGSLTTLLAHFDIDFSTANVADLLTNERYGQTYPDVANVIKSAGSWAKLKDTTFKFGVKDRQSFEHALCAVLRPIYGVLDVFLNDASLNLANIASVPGSDCYTSAIVPLLEAFSCVNVKTQYQYREDMAEAYDAILLDILDPLLNKVEDILNAPIETVADILPNLALFFANDGLLQVIDNLLVPVTAILDAIKPIVNVNDLLNALGVDVNDLLKGTGINLGIKLDLYDLKGTLEPLIGADNVVSLLNNILGSIKIGGNKLGIELPEIDWYKLASHGKIILDEPSQVATIGSRMHVKADQDETLIAILRFLIDTINYKGNYDAIVNLLGGLLGGLSDSIAGVIDQVLGMLKGDSDEVIQSLVELLQSLAG